MRTTVLHNNSLGQSQAGVLKASVIVDAAGGAVVMHENQHLCMHDASGWSVKAMSGTIWITQSADSRDIVLKSGESFTLDRAGDALVSSLGDANLCIRQVAAVKPVVRHSARLKFLPSFSAARALFA